MTPGSPAHRDLFCRSFIESHMAFEPETLPWPVVEGDLLAMLRAFPFWSYARSIEERSGQMVERFAESLDDPLIREAVGVQAIEEFRHERLMAQVLTRYGIDAPRLPVFDTRATREDFLVFGFGECTDVFVGLGAFTIARRKQLLPDSFFDIFALLLFEEARHVVFFINWWRYEEARAGRGGFARRNLQALRYHVKAAMGTVGNAPSTPMPKLEGAFAEAFTDVSPAVFLESALGAYRETMSKFDRRLVRPTLMPAIANVVLALIRMLPPRDHATGAPASTVAIPTIAPAAVGAATNGRH
jgi:hypothetical protein